MSYARPVTPGQTYMLTRRTMARFFFFRPDADGAMKNIFLYCLAHAASLCGIEVHAFVLMSTHFHVVVTDTRGLLPTFLRCFHRLLAVTTQCHRGWGEEVLNKSQTSRVELPTADAIIDKIGYVLANPVAALAVRYANEWPGARTKVAEIGNAVCTATKPKVFFTSHAWSAVKTFPVVLPALIRTKYSPEQAAALLQQSVNKHEQEARAEARKKGCTFLGARRCVRVSIYRRAKSYEVWGQRNPTFASGADRSLFLKMAEKLRTFRRHYSEALQRWRAGFRDVVFPYGTWVMKKLHHVPVAAAPT